MASVLLCIFQEAKELIIKKTYNDTCNNKKATSALNSFFSLVLHLSQRFCILIVLKDLSIKS